MIRYKMGGDSNHTTRKCKLTKCTRLVTHLTDQIRAHMGPMRCAARLAKKEQFRDGQHGANKGRPIHIDDKVKKEVYI